MPLSKFARKILLVKNSDLKLKLRKRSRNWVHEFNEERISLGELYHLYYHDKFYNYLRMTKNTFDMLLEKLENHLGGPGTNYRQKISPEQRLVLTVR
ncbi:hypothetical protein B7P43_G18407 [Cryptotermes secundus]|uniref:Uncharacterized protein n=1 Tax=Cryptotermes secundus TaxID=105785 RepID=A0A2J7QVJ8_9NEOP|nr:hypothetical protein B7P43_G18407 [Cryptotermes secundus]